MPPSLPTVDRLRGALEYSPESGKLRWLDRRLDAISRGEAGFITSSGYRALNIDGVRYMAHRVAWAISHGHWPIADIDHLNGQKLDNRLCNLRDVPRRVNSENQRNGRRGGLLGTAFHPKSRKWRAIISSGGKKTTIGYFDTAEQAHDAYVAKKRQVHSGCTI